MINNTQILTLVIAFLQIFSCAGRAPKISPQEFYPDSRELSLFDGKNLGYWEKSDYIKSGEINVQDSCIIIGMGRELSGITWTGPLLRMNYEINLDAVRLEGYDFFCGLTFPYGQTYCSLIIGGWDGSTMGLSNINDHDASRNETTDYMPFNINQWYHIRLRVTENRISAWIDDKNIVTLETTGKKINIRFNIDGSLPLGIASYKTKAAIKNITIKKI